MYTILNECQSYLKIHSINIVKNDMSQKRIILLYSVKGQFNVEH
jgi:hypothetical protein